MYTIEIAISWEFGGIRWIDLRKSGTCGVYAKHFRYILWMDRKFTVLRKRAKICRNQELLSEKWRNYETMYEGSDSSWFGTETEAWFLPLQSFLGKSSQKQAIFFLLYIETYLLGWLLEINEIEWQFQRRSHETFIFFLRKVQQRKHIRFLRKSYSLYSHCFCSDCKGLVHIWKRKTYI